MPIPPKFTPLHDWHTAQGAKMADFGGYDMPLWYSSAKNEHLAVLTHAGIFDTSHMAVVTVSGPDAFDLLQHCVTKDLNSCVGIKKTPLCDGRCVYGALLNANGHVIDDTIVYRFGKHDFMAVVNAGMGAVVARHLSACRGDRTAVITDLSDRLGKIDVQGPLAARILSKVLADPEAVFEKMAYFSFKGRLNGDASPAGEVKLTDGTPILLSRTGYTGEFGFEIFTAAQSVAAVWQMIMAAGKPHGLVPCGLAARDSLRAGAVLPLSHQDIGPWPFINHPWPFALPYDGNGGFSKSFIGSDALMNIQTPEFTYAFVGNDLRKVSTGDPAVVLDAAGNQIGTVLTCVTEMGIDRHESLIYSVASLEKPRGFAARGLCCGFVKVSRALSPGEQIELRDKRRKLKVVIAEDIRPARGARHPIRTMLT